MCAISLYNKIYRPQMLLVLGGVMVSVLVTEPEVRWFKPGRQRGTYTGNKNP
jgi:hypothetical protein